MQSPCTGAAAESGQFQEFIWADASGDGVVDVSDLASVAACFGSSGATAGCTLAQYNHWHIAAFESSLGTISGEVAVVASHLDDAYFYF